MRDTLIVIIVLLGIIFISSTSCTNKKAEEIIPIVKKDTTSITDSSQCDSVSFSLHVQPIFIQNCAISGCHNSTSARAGRIFETYTQIKNGVVSGSVICVINHEPGCLRMPRNALKLAQKSIDLIECWEQEGAPNN